MDTLKDLLMERIGYFEKTKEINQVLLSKNVFKYDELKTLLTNIKFDLRDNVEKNSEFLQPIPVAIISNLKKNKVLVIKKNKKAVSYDSPEKGKILLYIGGHSRVEDIMEVTSQDFLAICRSTLKREVKEEIGISIALNEIEPFFIYSVDNEKSRNHLAVCFFVMVDEDGIKLRLDSQELILNKGKSKSGHFLDIAELLKETDLEQWSSIILKNCFEIDQKNQQLSFFD